MTPTELALNDYIEKHIDEMPHMTISNLANLTNVSTATIERTVKKKATEIIQILSTVSHLTT